MQSFVLGFVFLVPFLFGCQLLPKVEDKRFSLELIHRSIRGNLPGGIRQIQGDGRVFYSHFFSPENELEFDPSVSLTRAYIKVSVEGDRRPYRVYVEVRLEELDGDGQSYRDSGRVYQLEADYRNQLYESMIRSLEERTIIDDFRSF